jgi:hypothetical protein
LVRELVAKGADVFVITGDDHLDVINRTAMLGATMIHKTLGLEEALHARLGMHPAVLGLQAADRRLRGKRLTPRPREYLRLAAQGVPSDRIRERMAISSPTAQRYRSAIARAWGKQIRYADVLEEIDEQTRAERAAVLRTAASFRPALPTPDAAQRWHTLVQEALGAMHDPRLLARSPLIDHPVLAPHGGVEELHASLCQAFAELPDFGEGAVYREVLRLSYVELMKGSAGAAQLKMSRGAYRRCRAQAVELLAVELRRTCSPDPRRR